MRHSLGSGRDTGNGYGREVDAPITDRDFAAAVFAVWLGEKPIQKDIKKGLVSRAAVLIR